MSVEPEDVGLLVARADKSRSELYAATLSALGPGEARLHIERFSLTTNNVTYAALNRTMPYFEFFPAPVAARAGAGERDDAQRRSEWGRLPVWGFAEVVDSAVDELALGVRVFGFFPAARFVTLKPAAANAAGFRVQHAGLAAEYALYGSYSRTDQDPLHLPGREDEVAVFRPLFLTGIALADYLRSSELASADAIVISSASSKTAYGLAAALRSAPSSPVIGLCSTQNVAFAAGLGVYDQVVSYDQLSALPRAARAVYVDIAGNPPLRKAAAAQLGSVERVVVVGATHGDAAGYGGERQQNEELFFAPGWIARRRRELGDGFQALLLDGWRAQMADVGRHFQVQRRQGVEALRDTYLALVEGRLSPSAACVIEAL